MRKFLLVAIVVLIPVLGQAKVKGYYRVFLESVEVKAENGVIDNIIDDNNFTIPSYSDNFISIRFHFQPTHIDFLLDNKSNESIKIVWDDVVYVGGPAGVSDGVFHSGVKIIDREQPQTPTTVVKGSKLSDILVVKSGVSFSSYFSRWMYSYILYGEDTLTNVKVLLPIEVKGKKIEYLFSFSVKWENVKVKTRIYDGKEYYIRMK
ncbi:hypothetical protein [Alistipes putredinis]|uniref:hypothetical protein n=1 Tax=Alistipes putredinis TaxID=28117 RepID=UPI00242B41D9|nr:hypothetical protein [Alistipes putredinis]MBS6650877.1 hypothetical protein [Alistipes putredinis]